MDKNINMKDIYIPDTDNKGYEAADKLIRKLQVEDYPKLEYDELLEFQKRMIEHLLPMGVQMPKELINY